MMADSRLICELHLDLLLLLLLLLLDAEPTIAAVLHESLNSQLWTHKLNIIRSNCCHFYYPIDSHSLIQPSSPVTPQ